MAIEKLQIGKKEDNPTRTAQIIKAGLPAKQYLTAAESNAVVAKINEMIPEVNVGVSGFQGKIKISDIKTDIGFYFPEESGVYSHAGNINVDISQGINHLLFDGEKWDKIVVPLEANGKVSEGDKSAVNGGEVFSKTMIVEKFVFKGEVPLGKNLYNKDSLFEFTNLASDGRVESTSRFNFKMSNYIRVKKGLTYILSGWYEASTTRRIGFFKEINSIADYIVAGVNIFTPLEDGYITFNIANGQDLDYSLTTQLEIGDASTEYESFVGKHVEEIKEEFLPAVVNLTNTIDSSIENVATTPKGVFNFVHTESMTKDKYVFAGMRILSRNLLNEENVQEYTNIKSNGDLETTSRFNFATSPYIKVTKNKPVVLSGWFVATANRRASIFKNIGDRTCIKKYFDTDIIIPEEDGYLCVFLSDGQGTNVIASTQVEYGTEATAYEEYKEVYVEEIKEEFLPTRDSNNTPVTNKIPINELVSELFKVGSISSNGEVIQGNITISNTVTVRNFSSLFVKGIIGKRRYVFKNASGEVVEVNTIEGEAIVYIPTPAHTFVVELAPVGSELVGTTVSFFNIVSKGNTDCIDYRNSKALYHKEILRRSLDTHTDLKENVTIKSTKKIKNAVVPIFLNRGENKDGFIRERFAFLGNKCQKDFSDIVVSQGGSLLPTKRYVGNYSLTPFDTYPRNMFQDPIDKYLLGNVDYRGLYKSTDEGKTWNKVSDTGSICWMLVNGDVFVRDNKKIFLVTKSSGYQDYILVFESPYDNYVMGSTNFANDDKGGVYMADYQDAWNVKVRKSIDGGRTWLEVFANADKQHTHKIWFDTYDKTLYVCVDGYSYVDNKGQVGSKAMATFKSNDYGTTWDQIYLPFPSDYGVNVRVGDYLFGSGECNIKGCPPLFRTKDLKTFEPLVTVPANNQPLRVFDNTLLLNFVAYGSFNSSNMLMTEDFGETFTPIFDTPFLNSTSMSAVHRYGTSVKDIFIDSKGDRYIGMSSGGGFGSILEPLKLVIGGDNHQCLCYVQMDLEIGDNILDITNGYVIDIDDFNRECLVADCIIEATHNGFRYLETEYLADNPVLITSKGYIGFTFPYSIDSGVAIATRCSIHIPIMISGVKTIAFNYRASKQSDWTRKVFILRSKDFSIYRASGNMYLNIKGITYALNGAFRDYYSEVPLNYIITLTGSKVILYVNGYNVIEIDCIVISLDITDIILMDNLSEDFIADIKMFKRVLSNDEAIINFEGFVKI